MEKSWGGVAESGDAFLTALARFINLNYLHQPSGVQQLRVFQDITMRSSHMLHLEPSQC
jgi:hypothetical protein